MLKRGFWGNKLAHTIIHFLWAVRKIRTSVDHSVAYYRQVAFLFWRKDGNGPETSVLESAWCFKKTSKVLELFRFIKTFFVIIPHKNFTFWWNCAVAARRHLFIVSPRLVQKIAKFLHVLSSYRKKASFAQFQFSILLQNSVLCMGWRTDSFKGSGVIGFRARTYTQDCTTTCRRCGVTLRKRAIKIGGTALDTEAEDKFVTVGWVEPVAHMWIHNY